MAIIDRNLQLSTAQAITVTAASTDSIDLLNARDVGPGFRLFLNFLVNTTFTSATATAALNCQLQSAPNNAGVAGAFSIIAETALISLGQLQAGTQFSIAIPPQLITLNAPVFTTGSTAGASATLTVASGTGIIAGMYVNGTGITPGTLVTSISGTTVTMSAVMTVAALTAVTFTQSDPLPRFLQANYVAPFTMTAGAITAWIGAAPQMPIFYPAGVTVPN